VDPTGEESMSYWFAQTFQNLYSQWYTSIYSDIQKEWNSYKQAWQQIATTVIQNFPGTSNANDAYTFITWNDLFTWQNVSWVERWLAAWTAFIPGVGWGEMKIGKGVVVNEFTNLTEHFIKHGKEFWVKTEQAYAKMAKEFMSSKNTSNDIVQWVRSRDWATLKLDTKNGNFWVVNKNNIQTTFYKNSQALKILLTLLIRINSMKKYYTCMWCGFQVFEEVFSEYEICPFAGFKIVSERLNFH